MGRKKPRTNIGGIAMLFEYMDANNRKALTDIERYGNLLIATELKENPGMSVTNACEFIATQYTREHGMQLDSIIFVERYDHRSYEGGLKPMPGEFPNYSLVTFTEGNWIPGKPTPHWKHLTESELDAIIKKETA
jgi:hypothetical protein